MSAREITIFQIARTVADLREIHKWLEDMNVSSPHDILMSASDGQVSDPAFVVALAAKQCYMSFEVGLNPNVTRIRQDFVEYFDNILASGHGSVLEHSTFSFALNGVSRVFTAEMNRHRAGWAISERSMRFIRFDKDIPWWLPRSLMPEDGDDADLVDMKAETLQVFEDVFNYVTNRYDYLVNTVWKMDEGNKNFKWKKAITSCLRRIVPLGVSTGGVWTGNVRALRHVLAMRCSPAAEEEIAHVFTRIAEKLIQEQPHLFGDFNNAKGYYAPKYPKV